jgi:hypothetical protein
LSEAKAPSEGSSDGHRPGAGRPANRLSDCARPTAPGDVQIPYGRDTDDRIRHISEVPSGLSGCVCVECGNKLVAYKGDPNKKRHHFAHRASSACSGGLETAIHRRSKEILEANTALMLPAQFARHGGEHKQLRPPQMFRYEKVEVEITVPGMRPDIIVYRDDSKLFVEVAVTHRCEEIKVARLWERQQAAIEIDLSNVLRDADPETLADALLRTAPRAWLYNRYVAQAEGKLARQMQEQAEAERARQDGKWGNLAADLTAAYAARPSEGHPGWLAAVRDAGLEHFIGVPIRGDGCFTVLAATWQSALIYHVALSSRHNAPFLPTDTTRWLTEQELLKSQVSAVGLHTTTPLVNYLSGIVPDFRAPVDVVTEFMMCLARSGLIGKTRTRWTSQTTQAYEARLRFEKMRQWHHRVGELKAAIEPIRKEAAQGAEIDFDAWISTRHDGMDDTPEQIAMAGGFPFNQLKQRLGELQVLLKPGAYDWTDPGSLLGLPLDKDLAARRQEQCEREETWRREREKRERMAAEAAIERHKVETGDFLTRIRAEARKLFGVEADTWLAERLPQGIGQVERPVLDSERMVSVNSALANERYRREREAKAEAARRTTAAVCKHELREQAARDLALTKPGLLELWLDSAEPALHGAHPIHFCVDKATLGQCLSLLPSRRSRGDRRR